MKSRVRMVIVKDKDTKKNEFRSWRVANPS